MIVHVAAAAQGKETEVEVGASMKTMMVTVNIGARECAGSGQGVIGCSAAKSYTNTAGYNATTYCMGHDYDVAGNYDAFTRISVGYDIVARVISCTDALARMRRLPTTPGTAEGGDHTTRYSA